MHIWSDIQLTKFASPINKQKAFVSIDKDMIKKRMLT